MRRHLAAGRRAIRWLRGPSLGAQRGNPEVVDGETGWFERRYFEDVVQLALKTVATEGSVARLVHFRLPLSKWDITSRARISMTMRLSLLANEMRGGLATFGRLSENEFAVLVRGQESFRGLVAMMTIEHLLEGLSAEYAVVSATNDGMDAAALIAFARMELERRVPNLVHLDAYRLRRPGRVA